MRFLTSLGFKDAYHAGMTLSSRFRREPDQRNTPPVPVLAIETVSDEDLGVKYRVALMMQSITQHVIGEYEADIVTMPDGEDVDDYYVLALRLGQYAGKLMDSKQDPDYEFMPVPELMLPEITPPEHS